LKWVIVNKSNSKWEKSCMLKNQHLDPDYAIPDFRIDDKDRLDVTSIREIVIRVFVPLDYTRDKVYAFY
jgi:hypothetical protein